MSAVVLIHPRREGKTLAAEATERRIKARGYHAVFRVGPVNHCPGCGRSHWWVGRTLAECAFCGTALPIVTHYTGKDS